jgi:hypothetical protein
VVWNLPLLESGNPDNELSVQQDGAVVRRTVLPGGVRTQHLKTKTKKNHNTPQNIKKKTNKK